MYNSNKKYMEVKKICGHNIKAIKLHMKLKMEK